MSSHDEIKLDYELAAEMAKTFKQGNEQLEATMSEMQKIAATLEGGALLGRGGADFADGLRNRLSPAIQRLAAKFQELEADVNSAINAMREADQASRGMF